MRELVARLALGDDRAARVSASEPRGGALQSVTVRPETDYLFGAAGLDPAARSKERRTDISPRSVRLPEAP